MRIPGYVSLLISTVYIVHAADANPGALCVASAPEELNQARGEGLVRVGAPGLYCPADKLSLKIDSRQALAWPRKTSMRIGPFDATTRHRVVVLCNGKAQQSFTFHFSEFQGGELCLFLNDLYKTVQLWETTKCPWCKCR
jgi:hypothetical protein